MRPQPPPDGLGFQFTEIPEGFRVEWVEEGPRWRVADSGERAVYKCRRPGCQHDAVAALNRGHAGKVRWWFYCADHLYGRRIEGGKVMSQRLVKLDADEVQP